jgi:hypothetical protein
MVTVFRGQVNFMMIVMTKKQGSIKVENGNRYNGLYVIKNYFNKGDFKSILLIEGAKSFTIRPKEKLIYSQKIFLLLLLSEEPLSVSQICMRLKMSVTKFKEFLFYWQNGGIFYLVKTENEQNRVMYYKIISLNGTSKVLAKYIQEYNKISAGLKSVKPIYALESIWNKE